ncbi:MAG: GNAT family N-acetyltransferase [Pseudomonadota bacterium]|nr:GNAT family N-acetyltransferase [Pseudomonadota bacterium]
MIYTKLDVEAAREVLALGKVLHAESRYASTPYNEESIWKLLDLSLVMPHKFFCAYSRDKDGALNGFFLGQIATEYFTNRPIANDLGMYVSPERRGSPIFFKMLKAFEQWAKDNKAVKSVLYHSTGINTEQSKEMFPRLGYTHYGHIFDKEL